MIGGRIASLHFSFRLSIGSALHLRNRTYPKCRWLWFTAPIPSSSFGLEPVPHPDIRSTISGEDEGEPMELVKCETSDILVPANAEIVVEGESPMILRPT